MGLNRNKGEHAEILAFLRILQKGEIGVLDEDGSKVISRIKIAALRRPETAGRDYVIEPERISFLNEKSGVRCFVQRKDIGRLADAYFSEIKLGKGSSFACFSLDEISEIFAFRGAGAPSGKKGDLTAYVMSTVAEDQGAWIEFSVKSEIGGLPTLLNAGATRFEYSIDGITAEEAILVEDAMGEKEGTSVLIPALERRGAKIKFQSVVNSTFEQNLKMIDTNFPMILGEVLKYAYLERSMNLSSVGDNKRLIAILADNLSLLPGQVARLLRYKLKELLRQSALGMNPGTAWEGQVSAHGGWILLRPDGAVCCFQLVNDDYFREYLIKHTAFDTPSRTKSKSGYVYRQSGEKCARIRLSLQVRFKKEGKKSKKLP